MTPAPRLDGTTTSEAAELAVVLAKLTDALAQLKASHAEPPLAFRKEQSARLCGIIPRLLERLLAAGKFPRPDAHAGRCPLWTRATLQRQFSRTLNFPIPHPIFPADRPVFPGFLAI